MNNYDPKLIEQINLVKSRLYQLEESLKVAKGQSQERQLRSLIEINKKFLLHLDYGQEYYRLEN